MIKLNQKHKEWLREREKKGELARVIDDKEVYRCKEKIYKMLPLMEESSNNGELCEPIWAYRTFYQDKNGKICKK